MDEQGIKGLDQLMRNLKDIAGKEFVKIFEAGTRGSAAVIAKEARRLCPVGRGQRTENTRVKSKKKTIHLRDTIKIKKIRFDGKETKYIIHAGKGLRYGHLVEFGSHAHEITVSRARALAIGGSFVLKVYHPGTKARPFMRPALDNQFQKSVNAFAVVATKQLNKLRLKQ